VRSTISAHARQEMRRRGIPSRLVRDVLERPGQVVPEREHKKAYQSQVEFAGGRMYLVRVIVDDTIDPAVVVTVYRTSKLSKYWSKT
jgi:hypothetical protein